MLQDSNDTQYNDLGRAMTEYMGLVRRAMTHYRGLWEGNGTQYRAPVVTVRQWYTIHIGLRVQNQGY